MGASCTLLRSNARNLVKILDKFESLPVPLFLKTRIVISLGVWISIELYLWCVLHLACRT